MTTVVELSPAAGKSEYSPGVPVDIRKSELSLGMPADKKAPPKRVPNLCSTRYRIAFIVHFCNFMLIAQNSVINITMVAMVNSTGQESQLNNSTEGLPANLNDSQHLAPKQLSTKAPVYDWDPQTQGIIFSSVQYGMMLMQAPGGYLAARVGTKKVVGFALLGSALLTLCTPLAADLGLAFLLTIRAVQGLTQGTGFGVSLHSGKGGLLQMNGADSAALPCQATFMAILGCMWPVGCELDTLSGAAKGMILGLFAVLLLGGIITEALGWPFVFYIFGGVGSVCCLLWVILVYDSPVSHPWISIPEREYILASLEQQVSSEEQPLPIKAVVRSLPLWSMCICTFSHQWMINTFIIYTPTYISSVFKINIRENGLLSSLPFFVAWIMGILGGQLADFLLTKNFRLVTVRKFVTFLGNLPPAALMVALPYLRSSYVTTITFLTLSCGISPLCQAGVYINALDIAPRYASLLMGTSRGLAHSSAVLVPIVGGLLLNKDPEFGWTHFFFILFGINLVGLIIYLIFGKADAQDWAIERKVTRL